MILDLLTLLENTHTHYRVVQYSDFYNRRMKDLLFFHFSCVLAAACEMNLSCIIQSHKNLTDFLFFLWQPVVL